VSEPTGQPRTVRPGAGSRAHRAGHPHVSIHIGRVEIRTKAAPSKTVHRRTVRVHQIDPGLPLSGMSHGGV
jgi:hypothetical protein